MKRLLIISRDPQETEVLTLRLEIDDFHVDAIGTPTEASRRIDAAHPDACIVDLDSLTADDMPSVDDLIKQTADTGMHYIFLAHGTLEDAWSRTLYAHHVVRKPYDLTSLAHMVDVLTSAAKTYPIKKAPSGQRAR